MWEAIQLYAGWYVVSRADAVCDTNGGLLAFTLEGTALVVAAALNADEKGGTQCKSVVAGLPDTTVNTVSFYRHIKTQIVCKVPSILGELDAVEDAVLKAYMSQHLPAFRPYTEVSADKAADFGLSPLLAGARRMGHLL